MPKAKSSASLTQRRAGKTESDGSHSDSVSQILPYLYVGPCSATSAKSTFVARQGITHIISVGKKPNSTLENVKYLRISIEDDPSADLAKAGGEAVAFIDQARSGKKSSKIFLHCSAGISRSPSIVAFYLVHSRGMTLKRALGTIFSARPVARPNDGFVEQLQKLELELRGSSSLPPGFTSLPMKKEERLALFRMEEQEPRDTDVVPESSQSALIMSSASEMNKENTYDDPDGHGQCTRTKH